MHERALIRSIVWVLSLALAVVGVCTVAGPASADAPGSITGVVTGPDDELIEGATVTAYHWDDDASDWYSGDQVTTDAAGAYTLADLPAGTYRLLFGAYDERGYLEEYWDDAATVGDAADVTVVDGATTGGKDAQLRIGGTITGTVTDPDSNALANATVAAFRWDASGAYWEPRGNVTTDADGGYAIRGLRPGTYRLQFIDDSGHGYLEEYWDDAPTLDAATDIAVDLGQTAGGKDAQLAAEGHISGTVTGTDDLPLDDVRVRAYRWDDEDDDWGSVSSAYTDADGHYDIGNLATGSYRLRLTDQGGRGYLEEYWDNAANLDSADDVAVVAGQTTGSTDAKLTTGGHITGTVTGTDDEPLAGIEVTISRWYADEGYWDTFDSSTTDTDGRYGLGGLNTGAYRIQFTDGSGQGYLSEYWDDAADLDSAEDIAVVAGETTSDIDARLVEGGRIAGTITSSDDQPLEDVTVTAYRWDEDGQYWDSWNSAGTDADGQYALVGLTAGTYRLAFEDCSCRGYLTEYWDDADSLESATSFPVALGETTAGKDAKLVAGGHITGIVTDSDDQPIQDVYVTAYRSNGDGDWDSVRSRYTQADGTYDLAALPAGTYRIGFNDYSGEDRLAEFWDDADSLQSATSFGVTAAETTSAKDAQLTDGGHVTGTVTGPDEQPVEDVRVGIYAWVEDGDYWSSLDSTYTDGDGHYDIGALPTGAYRLKFEDRSGHGYLTEYWDDADSVQTATSFSVTAGETTSAKDTELAAGGHITGTVTGPAAAAAEGVYVSAFLWDAEDEDWSYAAYGYTDGDGHYDVGSLVTGTYRIEFDDGSSDDLVSEYWDDAETLARGTDIAVVTGQTTSGKDAELALPGAITGTVTGTADQPLEDVHVTAYHWNDEDDYWQSVGGDYTDDNGDYEVDVPAGTYRLYFDDYSDAGYLEEYWDDAADVDSAVDVVVTSGATASGRDAQLALGGRITGTVTGPDTEPVEDVSVTAYSWDDEDDYWQYAGSASTDDGGQYSVRGLPNGTYRLRFADDSGAGHLTEYWDDATTLEDATDIQVTTGESVTAVDAALAAGGRISGTLTGPGGSGAEDVYVTAYRWDEQDESWAYADDTYSGDDGDYELSALTAGTYRLEFEDDSGSDLLTEYWDNATTLEDATDIELAAGETATDIDAELAPGGSITGTVTGPGGHGIDAQIRAYAWNAEDQYWASVRTAYTDSDGTYAVGGLATGTYRLRIRDDSGSDLLTEFWDDAASLEDATDIDVTAGSAVDDTDAELSAGAGITGTVTGLGGSGAEDIDVSAYVWDETDEEWDWYADDYTDVAGDYHVAGLPGGTYRLEFYDASDTGYLTEYWDDAISLETATDVVVAAGGTVTGIDAEMSDGSTPAITSSAPPTISGAAQVGAMLTATSGTWNPADGLGLTYRWLVGGTAVPGATTSTYVVDAADIGKTIQVEVTATRSGYTTGVALSAATAAVIAAVTPVVANATLPTVGGTPRVGTALTATPGTWNPAGAAVGYQWLVAGAPVAGATTASYLPVAGDVGKALQVRVTATFAGYTAATATSAAATVGKGTLKATKKPKVTGKAKKKATLTVSPGAWSPSKVTVKYQWFAGAKAIHKATASKLKLAGKTLKTVARKAISVVVTVTAPGYSTVTTKLKVPGKVKLG